MSLIVVQSPRHHLSVVHSGKTSPQTHRNDLLSSRVLNFYQDLLSSSILDLWKVNH